MPFERSLQIETRLSDVLHLIGAGKHSTHDWLKLSLFRSRPFPAASQPCGFGDTTTGSRSTKAVGATGMQTNKIHGNARRRLQRRQALQECPGEQPSPGGPGERACRGWLASPAGRRDGSHPRRRQRHRFACAFDGARLLSGHRERPNPAIARQRYDADSPVVGKQSGVPALRVRPGSHSKATRPRPGGNDCGSLPRRCRSLDSSQSARPFPRQSRSHQDR